MFFAEEIFNRKIEKISKFLYEVFEESARKMGKVALVNDFFEENPSFLIQTLQEMCENIMNHIISLDETENRPFLPQKMTIDSPILAPTTTKVSEEKNWNLKSSKNLGNSDFDIMKTFLHQIEKKRKNEFEEMSWKVENYKMFMDEKTQRLFEMSHCNKLLSEKAKENQENSLTNILRLHEEEKKRLTNEIKSLKELLFQKDKDLLLETRRLIEKEKNLFIEEEALKNQSLANNFKSREIRTRSKKIGEKELLLLMQSKSPYQTSKSFSNNL